MSHSDVALGIIVAGLSAYLLFGGADFGAGLWHLLARRAHPAARSSRAVIEHAMGPVWEANHVWLIFVMVLTWTAFPPIFASLMTAHWVPLSLAALGIVVRGSTFVFDKAVPDKAVPGKAAPGQAVSGQAVSGEAVSGEAVSGEAVPGRGWYAWAFGVSSLLTPYCLGAVAGAVALGGGVGWLSPPGAYAGLLTTGLCAYLAAVYLTWDARRLAGPDVAERFRRYALTTGVAMGALALPGAAILGVRSPLIGLSAVAGLISLGLLLLRRYLAVRLTAALAVAAVLWGAAELSSLDADGAAAHDAVLQVVFIALAAGAVLLLPSLAWLYLLFQRASGPGGAPHGTAR